MAGAYGYQELRRIWLAAGGSQASSYVAAAIALAESGGRAGATHRNSDGSIDRGLWQINSVHGYGASSLNAAANARQAVGLWHAEGFAPWTTFRSGAYKRYLSSAAAAVSAPGGSNPYGSLVGSGLSFAGVDQGIDFTGRGAIYAPGSGIITRVVQRGSGWSGRGALIVEKLDDAVGGYNSVYYAEDLIPGVRVGSRVQKGQLVGVATGEGLAPGIEIGFADAGGHAYGSPTGGPQKSGQAFNYFIRSILGKSQTPSSAGLGGLPGDVWGIIQKDPLNPYNVFTQGAGVFEHLPFVGGIAKDLINPIMKPIESLVLRGLLIVGGALLALLGLFLVAKALGASVPAAPAAIVALTPGGRAAKAAAGASAYERGAARGASEREYRQGRRAAREQETRSNPEAFKPQPVYKSRRRAQPAEEIPF